MGVEDGAASRLVPDDGLVREPELVRQREARENASEVVVERLLRAEDQPARVRVQSVRADHQVEGAAHAAVEDDVHGVPVVVERRDRVVEEELDPVPQRGVEHVGQITAPDLEIDPRRSPGQLLGLQRTDRLPRGVHEGDPLTVDVRLAQRRKQAHAGHGLASRTAYVDGVAAPADGGGLLDDGDLEAVPVEPVRERGARDTCSGDQNAASGTGRVVHGFSPFHRGGPREDGGTRRTDGIHTYLSYLYGGHTAPSQAPAAPHDIDT